MVLLFISKRKYERPSNTCHAFPDQLEYILQHVHKDQKQKISLQKHVMYIEKWMKSVLKYVLLEYNLYYSWYDCVKYTSNGGKCVKNFTNRTFRVLKTILPPVKMHYPWEVWYYQCFILLWLTFHGCEWRLNEIPMQFLWRVGLRLYTPLRIQCCKNPRPEAPVRVQRWIRCALVAASGC